MQIKFTGHHIDATVPLKNYATEKLERLKRHSANGIKHIDVTFEVEKLLQVAKATVYLTGTQLHADSKTPDMYQSIDLLIDKLDRQIKDHHDRETSHR